jgi:hypothetical protein
MLPIGLYLMKLSAYIFAFYIPFILFFKSNTFFTINRIYLVSGLLISSALPWYVASAAIPAYTPHDLPFMEPIVIQTESVISMASESTDLLSAFTFLMIIYLGGIIIRLIRLASSIGYILKLKSGGNILRTKNVLVVRTNTAIPFSFFNYVFLPKALDDQGILEHELAHVREYHWLDLLIVELVSIILWFNPVMIFYKRSLKQQHEYLADQSAIKSGIDIREYLMSIRQQIELAVPSPLISEFYFQSIKKRINMLTKKETSVYRSTMYVVILPIVICLLMAFSSQKNFKVIELGEQDSIQDPITLGLPIDKNNFLLESGYGERLHPVMKVMRLHTGIDLVAKEGISVVAAEEGVVVKAQMADSWGNIIVVQHDGIYSTSYSHLKSMDVKAGDKVKKGQVIGLVGHTGLSTKDHLHFELLKNGETIDPINYLPEIK